MEEPAVGSAPGPALTLLAGVRWRGREVPGERSAALLSALALAAPRAVPADRLVAEVWDDPPEHPDKALQVLVSRTRTRTTPAAIERAGTGYRLGVADDDVDLLRLCALVARGRTSRSPGPLREALTIPLAGSTADADSPQGRVVAEARRQQALARRMLGEVLIDRGDNAGALPLLEEALRDRPDDEAVLGGVLRAEAAVRGVPAALDRYASHAAHVREVLGSEPGEELRRLHADLLARDAPVREGLAYDANPLIGRDHDLTELRALLAGSRVLSIVGAGGLGKTRLAQLVGRMSDHPVVHFVGLAGVSTPEGVLPEVASALGVRDAVTGPARKRLAGPGTLRGRVAEQLAGPRTLLILDNCEHVLDAAADLVSFLVAVTADLQVLTTSRAPLGLAAEQVYQLPQLDEAAAVELFGQRARAARPGVSLDEDEVADLVGRLDGLPLAIELAAAKVRAMSVPEITRRLADRFALLRGGDRTAPERHRTLQAVIDWSWNLLEDADRRALRWLSVFPDGFDLAGAEGLLGHDPLEEVARLVEQSLLVVREDREDAAGLRYRMLETVREYAAVQLSEAGEETEANEALRRWAVDFARRVSALVHSERQVGAVARLTAEDGNLTALLGKAVEQRDAATALALGAALTGVWMIRGEHLTVVEVTRAVEPLVLEAEVGPEHADEMRVMLVMVVLNQLIFFDELNEAAIGRLRELGPGSTTPRVRGLVRALLAVEEDEDGAALRRLCDDPDPAVAICACQFASQQLENSGDLDGARLLLQQALKVELPQAGPWATAQLHAMLAGLDQQMGNVLEAERHTREALPVMDALGAVEDSVQLRGSLGLAAMERGDLDEAERILDEVDRLDARHDTMGWRLVGQLGRAELALARGRTAEGLSRFREAAAHGNQLQREWMKERAAVAPWQLFMESACLAAHVRYDDEGRDTELCRTLREKVPAMVSLKAGRVDFPVAGGALFALGCWGVRHGQAEPGVRLLVLARSFGYQQAMPSMRWSVGERLAEQHAPGRLDELATAYDGLSREQRCDEAARLAALLSP